MSDLNLILQNAGSGPTVGGDIGLGDLAALQKSLEAGYGTDVSTLTGGGALRIQSLDTTMQATIQDNSHFVLFNKLPKPRATATVDEWTEQYSVGGFLGGTTNTEDGNAMEAQGDYARMVGKVKYLSTYRKIPIILQSQNNIVDATALETSNGAKQLLTDIEYLSFEGDDNVVPTEFNGILRQMNDLGSVDNIIDMKGAALNSIDAISQAAGVIWGIQAFGTATDIIMPASVQTDLNNNLDPAFRVLLGQSASSISLGTHVHAVQTSFGAIKTAQDVFVRDERMKKPFEIRGGQHASIAAANVAFKPSGVTATPVASNPSSAFAAGQAGNYFYLVTGINANGQTQGVLTSQATVAQGGAVSLAIAASASGTETGYVIYRGRLNGTNALSDLREMVRVPKAGGGTTTYVDLNREIPGSTNAYVLNLKASDHAISWKQYLPMMKIPLYATTSPIIPWMQMICGYLRMTKRHQHVVIKNIVPTGAVWKPFN